jgi:hypothetical protein
MLLTALFAVFVLGFVILVVIGHVLLLQAFLHREADPPGASQVLPATAEPAAAAVPFPEHKEAA